MSAESPEAREWIIQRCTQRWVGTELLYEDWIAGEYTEPLEIRPPNDLLTHAEMLEALKFCEESWPGHEFRGHNAMVCRCTDHESLKGRK